MWWSVLLLIGFGVVLYAEIVTQAELRTLEIEVRTLADLLDRVQWADCLRNPESVHRVTLPLSRPRRDHVR